MATADEIIRAELDVWGEELMQELRNTLRAKKVEHSGQDVALLFENNLNIILTYGGGEYSWVVNMKEYWKYLEYGTKGGGWMPKEKVESWLRLKAIVPATVLHNIRIKSLQKQGKSIRGLKPLSDAKALPQLTYILQRSIYKKGISEWQKKNFGKKSTNFVSETLQPQVEILAMRLEKALSKPILAIIKEDLE